MTQFCYYVLCPIVVVCQSLDQIANGNLEISRSNVGGAVQYTCEDGFDLEGSVERNCLATGNWSGDTPACVRSLSNPKGKNRINIFQNDGVNKLTGVNKLLMMSTIGPT